MIEFPINNEYQDLNESSVNQKLGELKKLSKPDIDKLDNSDKEKIAKAAKGFEALFMHMMIKEMKQAMLESDQKDDEFGGNTLMEYSDMLFAEQIAGNSAGLGIAAALYKQLTGEDLPQNIEQKISSEPKQAIVNTEIRKITEGLRNGFISSESTIPQSIANRISQYDDIIAKASEKFDIPQHIIKAVIRAESAGKSNAVSAAGAKGLMQLMDGTARGLGVRNSFDPEENIMGGSLYLRKMLNEFDGDISLALAAYNAGPGNVKKYGGIPPFKETQGYVKKILSYINNENA